MDWLNKFLEKYANLPLIAVSVLSAGMFLQNLTYALSDGQIDSTEFHQLMTGANGVQALILLGITLFTRKK